MLSKHLSSSSIWKKFFTSLLVKSLTFSNYKFKQLIFSIPKQCPRLIWEWFPTSALGTTYALIRIAIIYIFQLCQGLNQINQFIHTFCDILSHVSGSLPYSGTHLLSGKFIFAIPVPCVVIVNVSLQLWYQMNNKKRPLKKMLCDTKENCQPWCQIIICRRRLKWILIPI